MNLIKCLTLKKFLVKCERQHICRNLIVLWRILITQKNIYRINYMLILVMNIEKYIQK